MAGVTPTGFEQKRLADILVEASAELALIVDPASGETLEPEFGSEDPAMQVVQVPLDAVDTAWQAAQAVFNQFDPTKAVGASLSALVELNGLQRQPSTPSTATVVVTGTPGTFIPAGQLVSDVDNTVQWSTDADVTLDGFGEGSVSVTALTFGPIEAPVGSIVSIVTAVPGWATVTNPTVASLGRDVESDTELRLRRTKSTMAPAASPVESLYANLANVPGVTYVRVYQNNTLAVDSRGIDPKSVAAVVVGGADLAIAQELLARTGVSAGWFGTTTVTLFDVQNESYSVKFSRPTPKPIYIELVLEVINPSVFPGDGVQQIKDAIIAYAQGGAPALGVDDGFSDTGFPPGAPVVWSRLFTPINFVPGHRLVSLKVDDVDPPVNEGVDVTMLWNEVGFFSAANIDITLT